MMPLVSKTFPLIKFITNVSEWLVEGYSMNICMHHKPPCATTTAVKGSYRAVELPFVIHSNEETASHPIESHHSSLHRRNF